MKMIKIFSKITLIGMLAMTALIGCEEAADLSVDPVESNPDFTFSPEMGAPGTVVTISGTGLDGVQKVAFTTAEANIVSKSDSEIKAEVPIKASSGKIYLTFGEKVYSSETNFTVSDVPVPQITGFSPAEVSRGGTVTITGRLLDQVKRVAVGDYQAEIQNQSAEEIVFTAPADFNTASIYAFYDYTTNYGLVKETSAISDAELGLRLPSISEVSPGVTGLDIGEVVTLTGENLELVNVIHFGDVSVSSDGFEYADGSITVAVPEGATSGTLTLEATDGNYEYDSSFRVDLPTITSFTPEKGEALASDDRTFSVLGSNFDLVESVMIGDVEGEIISITDTQILFSIAGNVNGNIDLYTSNGIVSTSSPFAFVGDFWVNDWDTEFEVDRFGWFQNNNLGAFTQEVVAGDAGNYAQITMGGAINNNSFYIFGPNDTGNDDWFTLYVSNPAGVYLEFDLKVSSIDDPMLQGDGTFKFKPFLMDAKGWGASGEYTYGYNGPTSYVQTDGEWQHFKMPLEDFIASGNGGLYTADQVDGTEGAYCHPNSLRIITFIFGTANEDGEGNAVIGLDNLKFTIE